MIGWAIGPYALATYRWPTRIRDYEAIISPGGQDANDSLIAKCVLADGVEALVLGEITGPYFTDPNEGSRVVKRARTDTTATAGGMPMFLQQGEADIVVTAGSNALLQNQWCAKGSTSRACGSQGSTTKTRPWPLALTNGRVGRRPLLPALRPYPPAPSGVPAPIMEPLPARSREQVRGGNVVALATRSPLV